MVPLSLGLSLKGVFSPETLEVVKFSFNQPLAHGQVLWPPRLKRLFLGMKWDHTMHGARDSCPASLEELHFSYNFTQPLARDSAGLPQALR